MKILFIGDIFGNPGIKIVEKYLPKLIKENNIDFVIVQGENVSNRKGLVKHDYDRLKKAGVNAFTMGNHVFSKKDIYNYIEQVDDIVCPLNAHSEYGKGTRVFNVNGKTLRVTTLLGVSFMHLFAPWEQDVPDLFFDPIDKVIQNDSSDFHFIDFHAETTSEKNVLGLYLDGKINAIVGTHTHVQTNDARTLPKGTAYITDVGMTGPTNCAIGAGYEEVYKKMRFDARLPFRVGKTKAQFNAVIVEMSKTKNTIKPINFLDK